MTNTLLSVIIILLLCLLVGTQLVLGIIAGVMVIAIVLWLFLTACYHIYKSLHS